MRLLLMSPCLAGKMSPSNNSRSHRCSCCQFDPTKPGTRVEPYSNHSQICFPYSHSQRQMYNTTLCRNNSACTASIPCGTKKTIGCDCLPLTLGSHRILCSLQCTTYTPQIHQHPPQPQSDSHAKSSMLFSPMDIIAFHISCTRKLQPGTPEVTLCSHALHCS